MSGMSFFTPVLFKRSRSFAGCLITHSLRLVLVVGFYILLGFLSDFTEQAHSIELPGLKCEPFGWGPDGRRLYLCCDEETGEIIKTSCEGTSKWSTTRCEISPNFNFVIVERTDYVKTFRIKKEGTPPREKCVFDISSTTSSRLEISINLLNKRKGPITRCEGPDLVEYNAVVTTAPDFKCTNLSHVDRSSRKVIKEKDPQCIENCGEPVIVTHRKSWKRKRCFCVKDGFYRVLVEQCGPHGVELVEQLVPCVDNELEFPPVEPCCPGNSHPQCVGKQPGHVVSNACGRDADRPNAVCTLDPASGRCVLDCRCCGRPIEPGRDCNPESFGPLFCKPGQPYTCPDGTPGPGLCPPNCIKQCRCTPCECPPGVQRPDLGCRETGCPSFNCSEPGRREPITCPSGRPGERECTPDCQWVPRCDPDNPPPPPRECPPEPVCYLMPGGRIVNCDWAGRNIVSVQLPCPSVRREPYPRGTVGLPNRFTIKGASASNQGSTTFSIWRREYCPQDDQPHIHKLFGFVTASMNPDETVWNMDERSHNIGKTSDNIPTAYRGDGYSNSPDMINRNVADIMAATERQGLRILNERQGARIHHIYETSSFDKPETGPGWPVGNAKADPAYQVNVTTRWHVQGQFFYEYVEWSGRFYDGDGNCRDDDIECKCNNSKDCPTEPYYEPCACGTANCTPRPGGGCGRYTGDVKRCNISCPTIRGPILRKVVSEFYSLPGALDEMRLITRDPTYDRQCGPIAVPIQKVQSVIKR